MKVKIRKTGSTGGEYEEFEKEAVRIADGDKEFLIKNTPEGLKIIEVGDSYISIRPDSGNSIILQYKK